MMEWYDPPIDPLFVDIKLSDPPNIIKETGPDGNIRMRTRGRGLTKCDLSGTPDCHFPNTYLSGRCIYARAGGCAESRRRLAGQRK